MPTSSSSALPDPSTPRYAVFGQPVAHSLSPRIHAAFAAQTGVVLRYDAIETTAAELPGQLDHFVADGGLGANITLPLKEAVLPLCTQLSARARQAGAVNTLIRTADGWRGDNTDGIGLVRDLAARHGVALQGSRVLLLGAGGAARGVLPALLDAGVAAVIVGNRGSARAQALQQAWCDEPRVQWRPWSELARLYDLDVLVDATSAGRGPGATPDLPDSLIQAGTVAISLNYGASSHGFLQWACGHGARAGIDGLGMLVEQAAESFRLWHGVQPSTEPVYQALRAA